MIKGPLLQGGLHAVYASGRPSRPPPRLTRLPQNGEVCVNGEAEALAKPETPSANCVHTARVAKQFKSPFHPPHEPSESAPASSSTFTPLSSTVRALPTIQALQGKVQTLKQAIKIKRSERGEDEEAALARLTEKWTTAGREVAWALWEYVRDLDPGTAPQKGGGWFTDEDAGQKRGWDEAEYIGARAESGMDGQEEEEEAPIVQHTLGVMLRRLGIDPATLGWDEEEGDFVDV